MSALLVDSNIPMYLVGKDHPHKAQARSLLERAVIDGERLVTDAEVFQEILHRYSATDKHDAIGPAFEALLAVVDEVFTVELGNVGRAREILLSAQGLSARDALHVAIMQAHDVKRVLSFDRGFDALRSITRIS
jgi:hypothetical protein